MQTDYSNNDAPGYERPSGRPSLYHTETIPLYSNTGLMLMNGRHPIKDENGNIQQHIIVGFYLYERKMRDAWYDASRDNPYGAWWVQRARLALQQSRDPVDAGLDEMDARLREHGFDLDSFLLPDPKDEMFIKVKTGLGLLARDLILDIDLLESAMLFLRSLGGMKNPEFQERYKFYRGLGRNAMRVSMRYHHFDLTPDMILDRTPTALKAEKHMGVPPQSILDLVESGVDACWTGPIVIDTTDFRSTISDTQAA